MIDHGHGLISSS